MPRGLDRAELRNCAVMLDTEAESLTEQMALIFGNNRKHRELAERRAELWRAANLLRKIGDGKKRSSMKKTQRRKVIKRSKFDRLVEGVAQDRAHASTEDITRERAVWNCTLWAVEGEIVSLQAKIASARARRANVEARLRGLAVVVGKR